MGHEPFPVRVDDVVLAFRCVDGGVAPGAVAAEQFHRAWPSYRRWFLHHGEEARPSYADCRDALHAWMPEIFGDFTDLVEAVGGGDGRVKHSLKRETQRHGEKAVRLRSPMKRP